MELLVLKPLIGQTQGPESHVLELITLLCTPADPCLPTAVSTSVDCLSNIAKVTWGISNTADYYTASAVGLDGKVTTCMSSTTSCGIATLQCGQKYNISVTASRVLCESKPSAQTYLNTGQSITVTQCKYCSLVMCFNFLKYKPYFNAILSYKDAGI